MVTYPQFGSTQRFRFNGFELDTATRQLSADGKPCHLEPRTYDLLTYLVRARHRVVTKEELFEAVWHGTAVCEGALSQCVSVLRKALADTGRKQQVLKTFPRIGYRFVCDVDEGESAPSRDAGTPASWRSYDSPAELSYAAH